MLGNSIGTAFRILMAIPFLLAMGYGLLMTKFGQEMQSGEVGFATKLVSKVGLSYLNGMMEDRKESVIDTAGLNAERVVDISRQIDPVAIGLDPEAMNEDELEVRLFGHGKMLADAECETLLASLAKACLPDKINLQILESGRVNIRYSLSFLPASEPGDLSNAEGRALRTTTVGLIDNHSVELSPNAVTAFKAELLAKAAAQCEVLKVTMGNCVVKGISITEQLTDEGMVKMTADAQLAALGAVGQAGTGEGTGLEALLGAESAAAQQENGMMGFLKRQFSGDGSSDSGDVEGQSVSDLLDPPSVDGADGSRFKDTKSSAKFVTAP